MDTFYQQEDIQKSMRDLALSTVVLVRQSELDLIHYYGNDYLLQNGNFYTESVFNCKLLRVFCGCRLGLNVIMLIILPLLFCRWISSVRSCRALERTEGEENLMITSKKLLES